MVRAGIDEQVRFEAQIRPLFRPKDRQSMIAIRKFDLWDYNDVSSHADVILKRLSAGTMPCDGAWPKEQVILFRRWVEGGKLT